MAIIIPHSFINGTIAEATEVNANFTAIKLFVDGLADGSEIEASAIVTSKINNAAVTTEKINNGNVTYAKLDSADVLANLAFNDQILLGGQVFG
jgi:molybdopterin-binding protein